MKSEDQQEISKALSDIVDRLHDLSDVTLPSLPRWPSVREAIDHVHKLFARAVQLLVDIVEECKQELNSSKLLYVTWKKRVSHLWSRVDTIRDYSNTLFNWDFEALIYEQIYVYELLVCLQASSLKKPCNYVVLPTGDNLAWSINRALAKFAPAWANTQVIAKFAEVETEKPHVCFQCQTERNFEDQAILTHEIFHAIIILNVELTEMLANVEVTSLAEQVNTKLPDDFSQKHMLELFCDYASVWCYGPVYLRAFAKEISLDRGRSSFSHPASDVRSYFLLSNFENYSAHEAYKTLTRYLRTTGRRRADLPPKKLLKRIGSVFSTQLKYFKLEQFQYSDNVPIVKELFDRNIPYVQGDVRILINNLPEIKDLKNPGRYSALVSESLRKINLLRQVKEYMREPEELFALPKAISGS